MLLAVAALVQAAPAFNPPLDRPIAYTVSETRDDANGSQRYAFDRRVTFRRRDGGFTAEVETLRTQSTSAQRATTMLERANAAMIGRRVILSLDASGAIVGVDDLAGVWAAQVDGLATVKGSQNGARAAATEALVAPLRAMTPEQQRERIGAMLAPLIGTALVAQGVRSSQPVSVPARGADGARTVLSGTEATTLSGGMLVFDRNVAGEDKRLRVLRRIDPVSGLIRETVETTQTGPLTVTRSVIISP